jgi:hypothetical protein
VVTTPELIDRLSTGLTPVRRLRPPLLRAGRWLLFAAIVVALLVMLLGVRPDLALRLRQPVFALTLAGSLLSGVLAAIAAFHLCLPDRSRLWLLLPAPALILWGATVGYGCLTDWVTITPDQVRFGKTMECFAMLLAVTTPVATVLFAMLRRAALLQPAVVGMTGGLAMAGVAATGMSILHDLDASVMVLLWNLGLAALMVTLGGALGRRRIGRVAAPPIGA